MRWPWYNPNREVTQVDKSTEVGMPWMVFFSSWAILALFVLVLYIVGVLVNMRQWIDVTTYSKWFNENFKPWIKTEWISCVIWMLLCSIPAGIAFYIRMNMEQVFKSWLPWDLAALIRKDKR